MHGNFPPQIAGIALDVAVGLMVAIVSIHPFSFLDKHKRYIASIVSGYGPLGYD